MPSNATKFRPTVADLLLKAAPLFLVIINLIQTSTYDHQRYSTNHDGLQFAGESHAAGTRK